MRAVILFAAVIGCAPSVGHDGMDVGKACTAANAMTDCYHLCITGSMHFPGRNFCSESCATDSDCPSGSACIAPIMLTSGAHVCAVTCKTNSDCASFGSAYVCNPVNRFGASGQVDICWVP